MNRNNVVLLLNIGSPTKPDKRAVKQYLGEFLADKRVVDLPRILWRPLLHGIILNTRSAKTARKYQKIWHDGEAPLIRKCRKIAQALSGNLPVRIAMRYGKPSIQQELVKAGNIDNLIVLPMFPQFSSATTASVFDALSAFYRAKKNLPQLIFIKDYHAEKSYINALANSVESYQRGNGKPDMLLISFHGLPARYIAGGDPYYSQCRTTARLLADKLELADTQYRLCFQSRFGKERWTTPYTGEVITKLAQDGVKSVQIISPGFSVDCLETLEELAIGARDLFLSSGGKEFGYIPCLNQANVKVYQDIITGLWKP